MDAHVELGEIDELLRKRPQAHVDPLVLGIPERDVLEAVEIEVGAELTVEHREDVLVERRRDSGGVVVGRLHGRLILDQIGAQGSGRPGT